MQFNLIYMYYFKQNIRKKQKHLYKTIENKMLAYLDRISGKTFLFISHKRQRSLSETLKRDGKQYDPVFTKFLHYENLSAFI